MLNKRTHVLFSEKDYHLLATLAANSDVSVGELIRKAVKKTYQIDQEMAERYQLTKSLFSLWEKQKIKGIVPYKQLVEDGRKD